MLLWIFLLISLAAGAAARLAGLVLWQGLLLALGVFVGLNVLYVIFWVCVATLTDTALPRKKQSQLARFGCASISGWLCAWEGLRLRLVGEEKLPKEGRFLLVCNHRNMFDPVSTEYILRKYNIAFISKPSNLAMPYIGRLAYGAGFLPINRENDREALKTILMAADYLKRDLCSICVYPEGTRSKTGELLPFHPGSFKIAQRAGVPVVVAAIHGTDKLKGHFLRRPKDVTLDILACIPAETVKAMGTQELAAESRRLMEADLAAPETEATA